MFARTRGRARKRGKKPPACGVPRFMKTGAFKVAATATAIAGVIGTLLWASMREEVELWKFADEVAGIAGTGQRLNVGGNVRSLTVDRRSLRYRFEIESRPPRPYAIVQADYQGLVPDTFKVGAEVVATGRIGPDGRLAAETIMAKCPSKYEVKGTAAVAKRN
jgi:cytochrome c-type biogenesis protein CcmE